MLRRDPYEVLAVPPSASDAELRAAYRRLVQRHHPDHNNGSVESARLFEEVQEAYAQAVKMRASGPRVSGPRASGPRVREDRTAAQPDVDVRIADLEREVRLARAARERAERAAEKARREAARAADLRAQSDRASDEELGYVKTDDSFSKLIDDAWAGLRGWLAEQRRGDGDR